MSVLPWQMKAQQSETKLHPTARAFIPYFVLAIGLLATVLVAYYFSNLREAEDQARFKSTVQEINSNIESKIETYTALLRAGTGLFAATKLVEPDQFKKFVAELNLQEHYPSLQGIGFSIRLSPEEKNRLVESMHRSGLTEFKVWPEYDRSEYHSIIYLEPRDRRNQVAIGYDMFTEPVRREAMEKARDTGLPAASGRVTLVQEIDPNQKQPGFLIYAPLYRNDSPISSEQDRRTALRGFVYAPFRADDFLNGIFSEKKYDDLRFEIYDGTAATPESLLHDSMRAEGGVESDYHPRFIASTSPNIAGRTWSIRFATRPNFEARSRSFVPLTLVGGGLISILFFGLTRLQTRARTAAERSANKLRTSEGTVRTTLAERERAEEALRESEERYRDLVENANDIVYTLDLDGNLTSINKAAELITGYSREEMLSKNLTTFLTPDSVEITRQMLERKLLGEERTNYEMDIQSVDGRILTLEISSKLVLKEGKPVGVQGIARDITTRRRAEEALRQADQRALSEYERLLERVAGLAQTLGTARDLLAIFRGLQEFTLVSVPCNGLFVSLYDPIRDVRTACYGWADEQEIDTSELPPMPVTTTGPNSRAVRTNQVVITDDYMTETLGHPAVLVGPDNGLRPQSSLSAPMSVMGRIIGTIEVQTYEKAAYREEHVTAMRMAANLTAVAIENVRLLERESTARATAEESNRLKDEFLATVSHELRTPLTAILGWARMLEGSSLETEMAGRAIETIKRNAKAQAQIIDDILDVSRIITGNLYLELHPMELESVMESAINVVRPTAEAKGLHIEVDFDQQPTVVSGDANRLQQVFWNLLSNAVKFTPAGGKVTVQLRQVNSEVEITVADTGQGITAEFLPFVFDRFRQADSTSTRHHGGLGLGLAIARHLIEIHGGAIEAKSPGPGKGATFTVRLPSVGSKVAPTITLDTKIDAELESEERVKLYEVLSGLDVLIVDDDKDTLDLLSAALAQRGAHVTAASSAAEAIASIKRSKPDVLVSDIAMPGEDGYELIQKVIALDGLPRIPAIAITAYAKEEDKERALSAGYQRYLSKPIELREFISAVAEAARTESPEQEEAVT